MPSPPTDMTSEKAREFFSAYYEGSIETGLRETFERALTQDSELNEEYQLFSTTLAELDQLQDEEIAVPSNLHEQIVQRLDQADSKKVVPMLKLWRNVAVAAVAATLIFGAVLSVLPKKDSDQGPAQAGTFTGSNRKPATASVAKPTFSYDAQSGFHVEIQSEAATALRIDNGMTGAKLNVFEVAAGVPVKAPITNKNSGAAGFKVSLIGSSSAYYVALPGTIPSATLVGQGSLNDLALAIAGYYRQPVVIDLANKGEQVEWNFEGKDLKDIASTLVAPHKAEIRATGLVRISD